MERDYEKYSIKIKRLAAVELASATLALLLVIFILFVPYFCKTTVEEILGAEEFKSFDEYFLYLKQFTPQELMRGEHVTSKSYSMFEELTFLFKNYRLANDKDGLLSTELMTVMIFPFSAVVMGIIILVINGKTLYDRITVLVHPEKSVMLKYDDVGSGAFDYSRSPRLGYGQNNQGAQGYGNPPQPNPPQYAQPPYGQPGYNQPNQPSYNQPYGTQSA